MIRHGGRRWIWHGGADWLFGALEDITEMILNDLANFVLVCFQPYLISFKSTTVLEEQTVYPENNFVSLVLLILT